MSVKEIKERIGYDPKPEPNMCRNCGAFEWDEENSGPPYFYISEKRLRCADHGFSVKKTATCKLWRPREDQ